MRYEEIRVKKKTDLREDKGKRETDKKE